MQLYKTNKKTAISAFVILAAVIITFLQIPQNGLSPQTPSTQVSDVDYYMKKYNIISNNSEGVAQYWFSGDEMNHYQHGVTLIDGPSITLRNEKQQIWTTTADKALITGSEQITLDGEVQIQQVNINQRQISIKTDKLVISLPDKTASSDDMVAIKTSEGKLSAKGMYLDFANNRVKLLSSVNAEYVAP